MLSFNQFLVESKSEKTYTIIKHYKSKFGQIQKEAERQTGTLAELIEYFQDVLVEGQDDWQYKTKDGQSPAYKINLQPKTAKTLVNLLNKSFINSCYYYHKGDFNDNMYVLV